MSTATATKRIRLNDRDRQILDHVHRYRVTTKEVLHRLFWEPDVSMNAVQQVLSGRLDHYLQSETLDGTRKLYFFTPAAAVEFGEEPKIYARSPKKQSRARHIAMLEYCCFDDQPREHITSPELRDGFPSFDVPEVARNSYFHTETEPRKLGWLEVDCTGGEPNRASKCTKKFHKRQEHESFRKLTVAGQFYVVLVTTSQRRKENLLRAFKKYDPIPLEIVVNTRLRDIVIREMGAR